MTRDSDATILSSDEPGLPAERSAPYADRFRAWRAEGGAVAFFAGRFIEGGDSGTDFEPELPARLGAASLRRLPSRQARRRGKREEYRFE